jgi:hypothetical protein
MIAGYQEVPMDMDDGEYEIFLTFGYDPKDIMDGDPKATKSYADAGVEFSVSKAKLIHAYNVTTNRKVF